MKTVIRNSQGQIITPKNIEIEECRKNKLSAVYVNASLSEEFFDADCAILLSIPLFDFDEYMADYLYSPYWCRPYFGKVLSEVPENTQGFLARCGEKYIFILPVCDRVYKTTLCGCSDGLCAKICSYYDKLDKCECTLAYIMGEGKDAYALIHDCAEYASELLGNSLKMREKRKYPQILEYLGWCSWDALQIRVNEKGLLEKCHEFSQKQIPVRYCIIDDMWADVKGIEGLSEDLDFNSMVKQMHTSTLYSFEGSKNRFPDGIKGCISKLHKEGMSVGIWYPTTGYWGCFDGNGDVFRDYQDCLIKLPGGKIVPNPDKAEKLYCYFNKFLKDCGADFLKIDNQSFHRKFYYKVYPVGESAKKIHNALENTVRENFGNNLINCMGMSNECMFNRQDSPVCRCSNDFLPENKEWFTSHILQCSYNSLIQGQYYYSDWDMWWTDDAQAVKNSLCRAISGGPIYVSDKMGRSKEEIFKPLCYSDGKILRPLNLGVPAPICLTDDCRSSRKPLMIFNRTNKYTALAAFNLDTENRKVKGVFSPKSLGLSGDKFVLYNWFSKAAEKINSESITEIQLDTCDDYVLYLIIPHEDIITPIGLTDKFMSPEAVICRTGNEFTLYEGGKVTFFCDRTPECISTEKRSSVLFIVENSLCTVELEKNEKVVKISMS